MNRLTLCLSLLCALPAQADPEVAAARALRHGWLQHQLPLNRAVDGRARPRLPSAVDFERVIIEIAPTNNRILPEDGRIQIDLQIVQEGVRAIPIFAAFFAPLEVQIDDTPVDFMHVPEAGELLVFLARRRGPGAVRIDMQVAFDDYCGDPTGCIERGSQHHLAQIGWYPLNGEVGGDDPFQVELDITLDDGRVPGATGARAEPERDGRRTRWHFETTQPTILPAFAIGPNRITAAGDLIETYVPPRAVDDGGFLSRIAGDSLEIYTELFGPYPYPRLAMTPIADEASVGLGPQANILLPESFWLISPDIPEAQLVAQVTAHEIAHQYFFNLVNIVDPGEGWMSEAFAEYAATRFSEARTGTRDHINLNYWDYIFGVDRRQDAAINSEQVDRRPADVRQRIIYYKGSALLNQLRDRFDGFDAHMRAYVQQFAGEIVTTRDFSDFMSERLGPSVRQILDQWAGRPGYPTLTITVNHPRDGADEMSLFIVQVDDTGFGGTIPLVAHFEEGGTQTIAVGIDRGVPETLDLGRAQWFDLDPNLTIFRRAVAEPAGDVNLSGVVDGMDLLDVLAKEGLSVPDPNWDDVMDADRDLQISVGDRRLILSQWGQGW